MTKKHYVTITVPKDYDIDDGTLSVYPEEDSLANVIAREQDAYDTGTNEEDDVTYVYELVKVIGVQRVFQISDPESATGPQVQVNKDTAVEL